MSADKEFEDRALPIPDDVNASGDQVLELMRVWWNGTAPAMNIRPALQEPGNIGVILAELAWHFSNAYAQQRGMDQAKVFDDIKVSWDRAHSTAASRMAAEATEGQ